MTKTHRFPSISSDSYNLAQSVCSRTRTPMRSDILSIGLRQAGVTSPCSTSTIGMNRCRAGLAGISGHYAPTFAHMPDGRIEQVAERMLRIFWDCDPTAWTRPALPDPDIATGRACNKAHGGQEAVGAFPAREAALCASPESYPHSESCSDDAQSARSFGP